MPQNSMSQGLLVFKGRNNKKALNAIRFSQSSKIVNINGRYGRSNGLSMLVINGIMN